MTYGPVANDWPATMRPGWVNRNRVAVGLAPLPTTRNMTDREPLVWCDNHPSAGGPHRTAGLYAGEYFDHDATLWVCTHKSRRGRQCNSTGLEVSR